MNFDRNYQTQISQNDKSTDFIDKIQKLPIVKKVYLYIFLMTVVGAAMGGVKYRLESINCLAQNACWTVETAPRRAKEIGLGAIAGMFAATSISIPALLKDN